MSRPGPWGAAHPAGCGCADCRRGRRAGHRPGLAVAAILFLPLLVLLALALTGRMFGARF